MSRRERAEQEARDPPGDIKNNTLDGELPPTKQVQLPASSDGGCNTQSNQTEHGETNTNIPSRPAGQLWQEGEPTLPRSAAQQLRSNQQHQNTQHNRQYQPNRAKGGQRTKDEGPGVTIIKQLQAQPISQGQLIAQVKGIYSALVIVETKCIEVDSFQNAQGDSTKKLKNEQWQALVALHRLLLHEHYDFLLASQHPSANPALQRLAFKYAMPARMWRHGIHTFLELLRHRLPASLEHMEFFITLAYSIMVLLYETVPAFEDTWIECLGDLSRYRMSIVKENAPHDRDMWAHVSRQWYSRASDKVPTTGRLHHHLAILARPNIIQQLCLYTKSLCVSIPFKSTRESIRTLFDPVLTGTQNQLQPVDLAFVKAHGILFIISNTDKQEKELPKPVDDMWLQYEEAILEFLPQLDNYIARRAQEWLKTGANTAIANCNSLLEYGKTDANAQGGLNPIMAVIEPPTKLPPLGEAALPSSGEDVVMEDSQVQEGLTPSRVFKAALELTEKCDVIVSKRYGDYSILPYFNVRLSFLNFMASRPEAIKHIEASVPWSLIALTLNSLSIGFEHHARIESNEFPRPSDRPFPEDWSLRGHLWTTNMFPDGWFGFGSELSDNDKKLFELPSMAEDRRERVLWLGWKLASCGKWLQYNSTSKRFSATPGVL